MHVTVRTRGLRSCLSWHNSRVGSGECHLLRTPLLDPNAVCAQIMQQCTATGALRHKADAMGGGGGSAGSSPARKPQAQYRGGLSPLRDPRVTTIKAEAAGASAISHSSGGFGGREFWQSLRSGQLEAEVRRCSRPEYYRRVLL